MPESFYGGVPGVPFIIVTNFASIEDMVTAFQQGPSYTAVHFDEHVLINTEDKNEDINGQIYRRGYDYTNDMGGAIYVGTIVGPAGRAPHLEVTTVENVKNKFNEVSNQDARYGEGSYAPKENLIPGKTESGYNDEIQWAYCSVRDENSIDTTAWIGFIIPTTVIEFEASSVNPYYNRSSQTDTFTNLALAVQAPSEDGELHPFWEKWQISIPKGIKGDSFQNLRIEDDGSSASQLHESLLIDYYHYDKEETGEPVTINLGPYNIIDNITLDSNGTLTIYYTYNNPSVWANIIKWIDNVSLDKDGNFQVVYNNGDTNYTTKLIWVKDIQFDKDTGLITIQYTGGQADNQIGYITWPIDIFIGTTEKESSGSGSEEEGSGDQRIHIEFNNGDTSTIGKPLNYVMRMELIDSDYHLLILYSDPDKRQQIIEEGKNYSFDGRNDWLDLGSVKEDSGIYIGLNYEGFIIPEYLTTEWINTVIKSLNDDYPNGLGINADGSIDTDLHGKIITVGNEDSLYKVCFAYDYNNNTWYYIGTIGEIVHAPEIIYFGETIDQENIDLLRSHGAWLVLEDWDF